jgi:hypothetical protein
MSTLHLAKGGSILPPHAQQRLHRCVPFLNPPCVYVNPPAVKFCVSPTNLTRAYLRRYGELLAAATTPSRRCLKWIRFPGPPGIVPRHRAIAAPRQALDQLYSTHRTYAHFLLILYNRRPPADAKLAAVDRVRSARALASRSAATRLASPAAAAPHALFHAGRHAPGSRELPHRRPDHRKRAACGWQCRQGVKATLSGRQGRALPPPHSRGAGGHGPAEAHAAPLPAGIESARS